MRRLGSLLACSLVSASLVTACAPADDPPLQGTTQTQGGSQTDSASGGSGTSDTSDTSDEGASGEEGTDEGETSCAELDCGFGVGIDNPDPATIEQEPCVCDCDFGYTVSADDGTCVLDTSCFQVRPVECRSSVDEGSAVGMLFSLTYCSGDPKTDLGVDDIILEEIQLKDWEELLPSESAATIVDVEKVHHIYLVLDISKSVQDAGLLPELETALATFISSVDAQDNTVRMSVFAFDGAYSLYTLVEDTSNLSEVTTGIAGLSELDGMDQLSTNLYGAVINGIIANDRAQNLRKTASRRGLVTTGTVIVVSDGDDEAGRKTLQQVEAEMALSTTNIITVGLGSEENYPTLLSLGRDGAYAANTPAQIESVFSSLALRMDEFIQSTYFLGYCSPKRGGTAQVRARFKDVVDNPQVEQEAICDIDATFFDAGCGETTFVEAQACASRECGGVIGCGTCGADSGCVWDTCVAVSDSEVPEEGECNDQAPCLTGYACINGECQTPALEGESCTPGCDVPNAYCAPDPMGSTCQPTGGIGANCTSNSQCASGNCNNGGGNTVEAFCTSAPPYRETCTEKCEKGSYCPGVNQKCERLKYDFEECQSSKQCRSGRCNTYPGNIKACAPATWAVYDDTL